MPNNFGLYFGGSGGVVRLPVNPSKLPDEKDNENGEYNVLGIGPIMIPRTPKLRVVSISSFFPGRNIPGLVVGTFQPPDYYVSFFQSAMDNRSVLVYTPVRYYPDGTPFMTGATGFECIVTKFTHEDRGGEVGDIYYDLEITEYRDYSPISMQIASPGSSGSASAASSGGAAAASALSATRSASSTATAASPSASQHTTTTYTATAQPSRSIPDGKIVVGSVCTVNGAYYFTSLAETEAGTVSNQRVVVQRIVDGSRPACVYVVTEDGVSVGWFPKSALQVVRET